MKTLLALLLAASPHAQAALPDCWIPIIPAPCIPHVSEGELPTRGELLRCVLADNTALHAYVRSANHAIVECAGVRNIQLVAPKPKPKP